MSSWQEKPEEKHVDLRVRRTRLMLQKAFVELIATKPFQSVTIQDIADRAMVNRATFYDHFTDKYALIEYSLRDWFRQLLDSNLPADSTLSTTTVQLLILSVYEFLKQMTGAACSASAVDKHNQNLPSLETQVTMLIREVLVTWLEKDGAASPDLTATITSWAIYGAAYYWTQQPRMESAAEFIPHVLSGRLSTLIQSVEAYRTTDISV